ncbi:MAG: hypothetical protein RBR75_00050 [Acholeplasmataceae bacterium]|jgi:hypothetical protein|nr:hypothetical protein [Acholeplasmataceae bacterium]
MKEVHVISIIGLIYAVLLALVTFIFFRTYTLWAVLGSATALFNHSLMIQATTKGKFSTQRYVFMLMLRYIFYLVIIAYTYFETKDIPGNHMIYAYVFLLLGIFSLKIGIFIYHTPLIKKPVETKKEEAKDADDTKLS